MIKRKDKIQPETRSTPNKKHDLSAGLCHTGFFQNKHSSAL